MPHIMFLITSLLPIIVYAEITITTQQPIREMSRMGITKQLSATELVDACQQQNHRLYQAFKNTLEGSNSNIASKDINNFKRASPNCEATAQLEQMSLEATQNISLLFGANEVLKCQIDMAPLAASYRKYLHALNIRPEKQTDYFEYIAKHGCAFSRSEETQAMFHQYYTCETVKTQVQQPIEKLTSPIDNSYDTKTIFK